MLAKKTLEIAVEEEFLSDSLVKICSSYFYMSFKTDEVKELVTFLVQRMKNELNLNFIDMSKFNKICLIIQFSSSFGWAKPLESDLLPLMQYMVSLKYSSS